MEMGGRASVEERNESTILVGQNSNRLDLTASNMTQELFRRCVCRDVSKIDGAAGTRHPTVTHVQHWLIAAKGSPTEA